MKQLFFVLALLVMINLNAQQPSKTKPAVSTGRWFVGNAGIMSLHYFSRKTESTDNVANAFLNKQKETGLTLFLPFEAALGSLQVGGSKTAITGNTNSKGNQNNAGIYLSPEIGKHFTDKISAGIVLRINLNTYNETGDRSAGNQTDKTEYKNNSWGTGINPFVQYFFNGRDQNWSPYLIIRPGVSFDKGKQRFINTTNNATTTNTYGYKENGWGIRSAVGVQKMLGKHFSFDVSLGYTYITYQQNNTYPNSDITSVTKTHQPGFETGLRYMF